MVGRGPHLFKSQTTTLLSNRDWMFYYSKFASLVHYDWLTAPDVCEIPKHPQEERTLK